MTTQAESAEVMKKVAAIKRGNPLDTETMMGAQASAEQMNKIQEYLEICKKDPTAYATAAERMLAAIGQPELV